MSGAGRKRPDRAPTRGAPAFTPNLQRRPTPGPQVLACIGEQFEEGDEVCGVTVNIRNGKNRIEMWTKTAANEALQVRRARGATPSGLAAIGGRPAPRRSPAE